MITSDFESVPPGCARLAHSCGSGQSGAMVLVRHRRQIAGGALAVLMSMVLTGCSPDNVTGIGLTPQGAPVLRNCGAWFRAVHVSDGQSSRVIWSAAKRDGASVYGVGDVQVGLLPDKDWLEQAPLSLEPRPGVWRFTIQFRESVPQTIDVADPDLVGGRLFIPGRSGLVSEKSFRDDVCGDAPLLPTKALVISLGVLAVVGLATARVVKARKRSV